MNSQNYHIEKLTREQTIAVYRDIAPLHFPDDELKPVSAIEELFDKNAYLGLGLYEDQRLLGYALFLMVPELDTVLLDYYAILEEYRDLGLGSVFLQQMKAYFKDISGILIETEDPDCTTDEKEALLRNRRNAFYYKNGAHMTDILCALFGVPFHILFLPTSDETNRLCDATLREKLDTIYRFMLPDDSYDTNVLWRS